MWSVSFVNILGHTLVSTTQIYQDVMGETSEGSAQGKLFLVKYNDYIC